jgi:glucosylceramidase
MINKGFRWVYTTQETRWKEADAVFTEASEDTLEITDVKYQKLDGFGGCFNELGWIALSKLSEEDRQNIITELFDPEAGCRFSFCRMPIGASDYAAGWYSHNENDGDYNMEKFSIERDRLYLLPYINEALKLRPDMKLFASPWSPPTWMKEPKVYNYGRLVMTKENLTAYALYFKKFIEAYKSEGIDISQIHIQNEPYADQKFPSCCWSGEQFRIFIREYLGPMFESGNMDTEIWLGTLNGPEGMPLTFSGLVENDYDSNVDQVLFDKEARKYLTGVGYQWAGKHAIQRTHESFPELKLMQTENECGDGTNSWSYARYVFSLIRHYMNNGVNSYIYWNMALEPTGRSTWGWKQNSLITVNPETKQAVYNPEFYVMKHFSHFVMPGAVRLGTAGHWTGASLAFENPNGEIVAVVSNALDKQRSITINIKNEKYTVELKSLSFNTFVLNSK